MIPGRLTWEGVRSHQGTPQLSPKLLPPVWPQQPGSTLLPFSVQKATEQKSPNRERLISGKSRSFRRSGGDSDGDPSPPPLHLRGGWAKDWSIGERTNSTHLASCCPPYHATNTVHRPWSAGPSGQQPCSHLEGQAVPSGGLLGEKAHRRQHITNGAEGESWAKG